MRRTILLLSSLCAAQALAAQPLTLDDSIRHTLDHHPELRAAQERLWASAEQRAQAPAARYPQVGVRYTLRRSDSPLDVFAEKLNTRSVDPANDFSAERLNHPDPSTLHTTELSVQVPVYRGGGIEAGVRAAAAQEQTVHHEVERLRELLVFRTISAYRHAQAAARRLTIADDAVLAAQGHATTTARLVRQGRTVVSDRLTAELNVAALDSQREQARRQFQQSLDDLKLAMGMALDQSIALPPWSPPPVPSADAQDVAALETQAMDRRADLHAARAAVSAGQAQVDNARAAFRPQIDVIAASHWYDDNLGLDNNAQSIMGVVSMNLYNGGRNRHGLAAARHLAQERSWQLRQREQQVRAEVRRALHDWHESRARLQIAAQNVDKARETVGLVKRRYGEGRTILLDVLAAERNLVDARQEELTAGLNLLIHQAALALATGTPMSSNSSPP